MKKALRIALWMVGACVLLVTLAALALVIFFIRMNELPSNAAYALRTATTCTIYSLEPEEPLGPHDQTLQGFKILGQAELNPQQTAIATAAFRSAISGPSLGEAMCFNPRHALRIVADGHTYDFLLCYACMQLWVYEDNEDLRHIPASGSSKVLNNLLTAVHLPLSQTDTEEQREAEQKQRAVATARWLANMPASFLSLWPSVAQSPYVTAKDLEPFRQALLAEFPDPRVRIRALLTWYGSGAGPWSGFPAYESIAETLLLDFPTDEIVNVVQSTPMTDVQLEGAARLFADWDFAVARPNDRNTPCLPKTNPS